MEGPARGKAGWKRSRLQGDMVQCEAREGRRQSGTAKNYTQPVMGSRLRVLLGRGWYSSSLPPKSSSSSSSSLEAALRRFLPRPLPRPPPVVLRPPVLRPPLPPRPRPVLRPLPRPEPPAGARPRPSILQVAGWRDGVSQELHCTRPTAEHALPSHMQGF